MARHAELQQVLDQWAGVLAPAADGGDPVRPARNLLCAFRTGEILPHTRAEERTFYPAGKHDRAHGPAAAGTGQRAPRPALWAGHLAAQAQPAAVAAAEAVSALFASHVAKGHDLLLPALEPSGADVAGLLARENHLAGSR